jgi:glutamine amidotransferase
VAARISIVDYSLGNLESIRLAFAHVGVEATVTGDPRELRDARALILPGVGAFGDAMKALEQRGLIDVLHEFAASGRPLVGICLGMQLLLSGSEEFGDHAGLGLIPGRVRRFPSPERDSEGRIGTGAKVPQVGWNRVEPPSDRPAPWKGSPLEGITPGSYLYFMHSFYVAPDSATDVLGETEYADVRFCSALQRDNLIGFQFHPERSSEAGLAIYRNLAGLFD